MQVLNSYVIYKRLDQPKKVTNILLPETQRYANILAEIVAIGPGEFNEEGELEYMGNLTVGDKVVIDQQSGRPINSIYEYCHISEVWSKVDVNSK